MAPFKTTSIIFLTLCSQLSLLVAFLLPLKVLILFGSSNVPNYFPYFLQDVEKNNLIVRLSLSAILFYLFYFITDLTVSKLSSTGGISLVKKAKKMMLFSNQDEMARQGYQRYSRAIASAVIVCCAFVLISVIYIKLAAVIFAYCATVFFLFSLLARISNAFKKVLKEALSRILAPVSMLLFLLSFCFIVYEYLSGSVQSVLFAIISLIVVRQMATKMSGMIIDLHHLFSLRLKYNAIFFHRHTINTIPAPAADNFWQLLDAAVMPGWVKAVIKNAGEREPLTLQVDWVHIGVPDVIACDVEANFSEQEQRHYFIKVFEHKKSLMAEHERLALIEIPEIPALKLLAADEVGGFPCHIFEVQPCGPIAATEIRRVTPLVVASLMVVEPSSQLVNLYLRSRPTLAHRLDKKLCARLMLVAKMASQQSNSPSLLVEQLQYFSSHLEFIKEHLQSMPLAVVNPDIRLETLRRTADGKLLINHWGRWSLEPIGAGWPIKAKDLTLLDEILPRVITARSDCNSLTISDLAISALLYHFEFLCGRQNYPAAFNLLPKILEYLSVLLKGYSENKVIINE